MTDEKSALIAMSGGVDSSVAAYLMLSRGYRCQGVTMRLYHNEDIGLAAESQCCSAQDVEDAARVAEELGMPFGTVDYAASFRRCVIEKFIRVYEAGGTPNPCIDCNRTMKFMRLMDYADGLGLRYVVTGHYARVEQDAASGRFLLKKAADTAKDQSYVLYNLTQEELSRVIFPLGALTKPEVREIARREGFVNARKHESQDICFVPDGDYGAFMERYTGKTYPEGDFLDRAGNVIGRHKGAVRYTLGQRRGLGLAMGEHVYVTAKDMAANTVTVGRNEDLFTRELVAEDVNLISIPALTEPMRAAVKSRYRQKEAPATLYPYGDGLVRVVFDEPQRAITPGQAAVFYDGDTVIGGGTITSNK